MEESSKIRAQFKDSKNIKVVGFLSNFEVYEYFKQKKEDSAKNHKQAQKLKHNTHLNTITYETLQYLQNTPCIMQSKSAVVEFMTLIQPYGLTKAERLTILNTRPSQPVDIQAIVEESEERLSEDQINEIIDIVDKTLPPIPSTETEEQEEDAA